LVLFACSILPWNIEKLEIVKKQNIKEHIGEGLKQYEYIVNKYYL